MKPITHEYGQDKGILKYFPYEGAPCLVSASGVTADKNGNKIVPAGTPWPSNDGDCLGFLLHPVDVTQGDAPGTYVFEGTIDPAKLVSSNLISSTAKKAVPKVNFFGEAY